ncbi:MAG: anthranilate phosphoribosyltransferase [Acidobacteria bacterium]|nr:anthranilate phosphoribosyltransferase [Acidobacteriota bacterium]
MILEALDRIVHHRESLSRHEARSLMDNVLSGNCTDVQIAALLVGLHMKGETVEEIVGFAEAIRRAATPVKVNGEPLIDASGTGREALVDTCGTGGDAAGTFNISTAAALVVAGAGVRVAKHGNRSSISKVDSRGMSAKCGAADVMEALGVNIQISADRAARCLRDVGITFLFAPVIHSAAKYVQLARRETRLRTVFNLLGPLTNPAGASAQVVGVYALELVEKLAEVLSILGILRAFVVHGLDGLDEITITGPTRVAEVNRGQVRSYEVTPEEFGVKPASLEDISGGDARDNARILRHILQGERSPRRDVVLMNAAVALVAAERSGHLPDALALAAKSIDSGSAAHKLDELVRFTNLPEESR